MKLFNLNQSKILTINSDFLKNSRNALLLFLLSHFAIIGFFFFKEHALLFSDDNADSSFEKGKTDPQQVLLAKNTMDQRKGQGMMNGAPRCKLRVICPHGGSQPWGASRECHKLIPRELAVTWLCLFQLFIYCWFSIHLSNSVLRNGSMELFHIFEKTSLFITSIFAFGDLGPGTWGGGAPVLVPGGTVSHSSHRYMLDIASPQALSGAKSSTRKGMSLTSSGDTDSKWTDKVMRLD